MKFTTAVAFLVPAVMAVPSIVPRQTAVTDELLFSLSLPAFISRWNAKNPPSLDWSSDSCSSSPDNPFGFPFDPACKRHDFGYRNYKAQGRFSDANKLAIDNNFKDDLYYQCSGVSGQGACEALANVYYEAVRAFGREGREGSESLEELTAYQEAVAAYEAEVAKAQESGELPAQ